jgi:hypothetical protein
MRANEFITEVFQPGKQNWKWRYRGSEEAVAEFVAGNRTYQWQSFSHVLVDDPSKWEVQFRLLREIDDPEDLDLFCTNFTGNSLELMSRLVGKALLCLTKAVSGFSKMVVFCLSDARR